MVFDKTFEEGIARKGVLNSIKVKQHSERILQLQEEERRKQHDIIRQSQQTSISSTGAYSASEPKVQGMENSMHWIIQQVTTLVLLCYGLLFIDDRWLHWQLYRVGIPLLAGGLFYFGMHCEKMKEDGIVVAVLGLLSGLIFCISAFLQQLEEETGWWAYLVFARMFYLISSILIFMWYLLKL